ncbi:hypothetical protein PMKS-003665 [Pichia membranifaciens]|uniref:Uncharacterized protein n=1 Tax=Pichia membranifaciens TaxID=4926 RepID=A0A1Q2YKS5_9ASCO|nr:hypothetical protein PMKS-003665 [Pichia membranifaciens]
MQADSQLKLLIRTSKAKLEFKVTKSRALSSHTIQTTVIPELHSLAAVPNDSRPFERGLDILNMKLAQMVRNDRTADVWEDLIGELSVLENSLHQLVSMMEEQRELAAQRQLHEKNGKTGSSKSNSGKGWSFLGFTFTDKSQTKNGEEQGVEKPASDSEALTEELPESMDRVTKVVRNIVVAQDYLSDDIKELHKLALALSKCIDKSEVLSHSPDTKEKLPADAITDLEDRIYVEIVRKLRGDDEETVVTDYMNELCDIYRIDLYNEGKYKDDVAEDDGEGGDNAEGSNENKLTKPQVKKGLDDLDDLKQRFEALKKS